MTNRTYREVAKRVRRSIRTINRWREAGPGSADVDRHALRSRRVP
ncbi:hypothetical protein [Microbacterium sp. ANT_H45B]|nr:hypothetical protein [Microbacterium sp. ANT_H45B]